MEYGQLLFARASLLCCNNLSPPASEQAASHPGIKAPDMIENAHDAGFAVCRHRHGMKAMLMYPLQLFHFTRHVVKQHALFSEQQKCLFIPGDWLGRIEASLQDVGAQIRQAQQC